MAIGVAAFSYFSPPNLVLQAGRGRLILECRAPDLLDVRVLLLNSDHWNDTKPDEGETHVKSFWDELEEPHTLASLFGFGFGTHVIDDPLERNYSAFGSPSVVAMLAVVVMVCLRPRTTARIESRHRWLPAKPVALKFCIALVSATCVLAMSATLESYLHPALIQWTGDQYRCRLSTPRPDLCMFDADAGPFLGEHGWSTQRLEPDAPMSLVDRHPRLSCLGFSTGLSKEGLIWIDGPPSTVAMLMAAATVYLVRRRRIIRRLSANRCPACGYDLRATPGRCPECGRAMVTGF